MSTVSEVQRSLSQESSYDPTIYREHSRSVVHVPTAEVIRDALRSESSNGNEQRSFSSKSQKVLDISARIGASVAMEARARPSFQALQEWEGYVVKVGPEAFVARLIDKTRKSDFEEEEAEFPMEDVSDSDLSMVKPGAIFRWALGYQREPGGTKKKTSQLVFRKLPAWSKKDIACSQEVARRIANELVWE